ncbi:MAG: hypothetical protein AB9M53_00715 [Leptothrix sp. (in: b-proteobacteria)]
MPLIQRLSARRNDLLRQARTLAGAARDRVMALVAGFNERIVRLLVTP